ncbi:MAG: hypothetical protein ACI8RD_009209 [Bacillariaceae sp.]|jgi:hypothetical protein
MRGDDDDDDGGVVDAAADDLPDREDGVPGDCWNRRSRLLLPSMMCVYVLSIVCKFFLSSTLLHNELGGDVHFRCTCSSNLVVAAYFNSSSHSFTLSLMIPILLQIKFLVGCRLIMREDRV